MKRTGDPRTIRVNERLDKSLSKMKTVFRTGEYSALFSNEMSDTAAKMQATRDLQKLKDDGKIKKVGQGQWEKVIKGEGSKVDKPEASNKKRVKNAKKRGSKKTSTRKTKRK